jgi:hypothetical protein
MICRVWRGWTTPENADAYEKVVRGQVIPAIEKRRVPGFQRIDLMQRPLTGSSEVEFSTLMWFDDLEAVRTFAGQEYETSHVPTAARAVLSRFDESAAHYNVIDQRPQAGA